MSRAIPLFVLIALAACAAEPARQPSVRQSSTADQVMAAQYHASGAQGSMSGNEAGTIRQAYLRQLTATPNPIKQVAEPMK